jgi:hypothetical protein
MRGITRHEIYRNVKETDKIVQTSLCTVLKLCTVCHVYTRFAFHTPSQAHINRQVGVSIYSIRLIFVGPVILLNREYHPSTARSCAS